MSRIEKVAAFRRRLAELRSSVQRLSAETFTIEQKLREVDLAFVELAAEDGQS